jgi:hypothetical protein
MSTTDPAKMVEAIGRDAVEFLCAAAFEDVVAHLSGGTQLDAARGAVAQDLMLVAAELALVPHGELLLGQLCEPDEGGTSVAQYWMQRTGQHVTVTVSSDPVAAATRAIAAEAYPALLMQIPRRRFELGLRLPFRSEARRRFEEAVLADTVLTRLFTERDTSMLGMSRGTVYRSTGHGGGLQLFGLAETLVGRSWDLTLAGGSIAFADLEAHLDSFLDVLRRAIVGKPTRVPVAVGLTGALFPDGLDRIQVAGGELFRVTDYDRRLIPEDMSHGLTTTTPTGDTIAIDYAGDLVFRTTVAYELVLGERELDAGWPTASHWNRSRSAARLWHSRRRWRSHETSRW